MVGLSGVRNGSKLARKFVMATKFQGLPKTTDLKVVEETLPPLGKGEILCKAEWLTVDPYMRAYSTFMKAGDAMPGAQVARVIASENPEFPEGSQVVGNFGWRDVTVTKVPPPEKRTFDTLYKMPDLKGLPDSYALGSCGMPGVTAYFGLSKICEPKPGDTLVVSSAAGAVGSLVGQFGKIAGCRVLGFAGNNDKLKWLKNDLGFDEVFNYKSVNVLKTLKEHAPKGVNCYFDNVGGEFAYNVMKNMAMFGRIAVCGAITVYNDNTGKPPLVPLDYFSLIYKNVRMEGFMVLRWSKEWNQGVDQIRDWILQGKLKIQETKVEGFAKMPDAFIDLLEGKNTGKMIIKA